MTAWTSSETLRTLNVPGVYGVRRERAPREAPARTDVAGFIGFEPRVRPVSATLMPMQGIGPGHAFVIAISPCRLPIVGGAAQVSGDGQFELSIDPFFVPMQPDQAVQFALAVVDAPWRERAEDHDPAAQPMTPAAAAIEHAKRVRRRRNVVVVEGTPAPIGRESPPDDDAIGTEVRNVAQNTWQETSATAARRGWARLANVQVQRVAADSFMMVVRPGDRTVRCDDWRDFVLRLGPAQEDGTFLASAVRGFFACGGSRCYISLVDRPEFDHTAALARSRNQMIGDEADSAENATGLARLVLIPEVAVVDAPDLHAVREAPPTVMTLPPPADDACFRTCRKDSVVTEAVGPSESGEPLYDAAVVTQAQIELATRCVPHRWRLFVLLCPPITRDPTTGRFGAPTTLDAEVWRTAIYAATSAMEEDEPSVAALYYPWLVVQESIGEKARVLPPTGFVAGIIASRDLRRGSAVSPANERVETAVGTSVPISDDVLANLYSPEPGADGFARPAINVLRSAAGAGVELWGARTACTERWLRFIAVRRGLSAVQRRCHAALQCTVFEPNTPALWMQVTQIVLNVLMSLFHSGALRGASPEEAFYVRCDSAVNPPEGIAAGQLVVEVGVAIAAPAEFVVFRLGRREGIVEVLE